MSAIRQISQTWSRSPYPLTILRQKKASTSFFSTRLIIDGCESPKYFKSLNQNILYSHRSALKRFINTNKIDYEREHFPKSESASYEGSGKTTVTILNEDVQYILIDSISLSGFRLNTGLKAFGPMAVFPNAVLSWRVMDFLQVDERALSLFTIIEPKPDIVILGYGDRPRTAIRSPRLAYDIDDDKEEQEEKSYRLIEKRNKEIAKHCAKLTLTMKQKKINLECLPTEDACSAYNYLVSEDRLVAAALIPPDTVSFVSENQEITSRLAHGEDPNFVSRNQIFGDGTPGEYEPARKLKENLKKLVKPENK